jgi:hypothetical protein
MTRPWQTLDRRETSDGVLELRQRNTEDFLICLDGRVLMNSAGLQPVQPHSARLLAGQNVCS